ncbi:2-oxo acid dehydrogenase subunit E2 [Gammaproteobacteria bacterium]|nr:2-oxo acid dehydrogenase subunit E2 [Gammaproteobacteria bacterium]
MVERVRKEIVVPDLGGHQQSRVIEIIVTSGAMVKIDQGIITLESEKAAMEVPSPYEGEVLEICVNANDMVSPGDVIAVIDAKERLEKKEVEAVQKPVLEAAEPVVISDSVHAGPFVRRIAQEMGLDLDQIKGSGSSGQIMPKDIEAYLRGQNPKTSQIEYDLSVYDYEPVMVSSTGVYAAKHLMQCWQSIPMVTHHCHIDITNLEALRQTSKEACAEMGGKLTLLPILIKVLQNLLIEHPVFNRLWQDEKTHAQLKSHHVGIAVDTPNGLLVPVIKDVNCKDIMSISKEILQLANLAQEGKLSTHQMQGGSITISSLGHLIDGFFTPIVNAPQASIVGVTKATLVPSVIGGRITPRLMLPISLSYDHRVINGADAARFLRSFQSMVDEMSALNDALLIYS